MKSPASITSQTPQKITPTNAGRSTWSGLATPPCAGSSRSWPKRMPITISPGATSAAVAAGRHRDEGRWPSGKSSAIATGQT